MVTGSLRINVSGLQEKELDIPYIEDTSATKPKVGWQWQCWGDIMVGCVAAHQQESRAEETFPG